MIESSGYCPVCGSRDVQQNNTTMTVECMACGTKTNREWYIKQEMATDKVYIDAWNELDEQLAKMRTN